MGMQVINIGEKKTHEEFVSEVYELVGDEYIVIGKYQTTHTPIKMKHVVCGSIINVRPSNF